MHVKVLLVAHQPTLLWAVQLSACEAFAEGSAAAHVSYCTAVPCVHGAHHESDNVRKALTLAATEFLYWAMNLHGCRQIMILFFCNNVVWRSIHVYKVLHVYVDLAGGACPTPVPCFASKFYCQCSVQQSLHKAFSHTQALRVLVNTLHSCRQAKCMQRTH